MLTRRPFWMAPLAMVIAVGAIFTSSPAQASISQGYVAGSGVRTDDWGDEGEISTNSYRNSGATGLWQWVLYADGAIESNGGAFDQADIDCDFGPNTVAATKSWQRDHDLTDDGRVGVNTFSKADNNLVGISNNEQVRYVGKKHTVWLAYADGPYYVDVPGCTCEGATFLANYGRPESSSPGSGCW